MGLLLDYLQNDLQCMRKFCWISVRLSLDKVLQSPSQARILYLYYYQQSDFFAPVCELGTLGPLERFFNTECLKMHHNDLK